MAAIVPTGRNSMHKHREAWLNDLADKLWPLFVAAGMETRPKVRITCGWPSRRAARNNSSRTIGECWHASVSADSCHEIIVTMGISDPIDVGAILVHEYVHACLPLGTMHKAPFKRLATAVGLEGKMTATSPSEELVGYISKIVDPLPIHWRCLDPHFHVLRDGIGPYPHAELDFTARKKQSTRMLKYICDCDPAVIIRHAGEELQAVCQVCGRMWRLNHDNPR